MVSSVPPEQRVDPGVLSDAVLELPLELVRESPEEGPVVSARLEVEGEVEGTPTTGRFWSSSFVGWATTVSPSEVMVTVVESGAVEPGSSSASRGSSSSVRSRQDCKEGKSEEVSESSREARDASGLKRRRDRTTKSTHRVEEPQNLVKSRSESFSHSLVYSAKLNEERVSVCSRLPLKLDLENSPSSVPNEFNNGSTYSTVSQGSTSSTQSPITFEMNVLPTPTQSKKTRRSQLFVSLSPSFSFSKKRSSTHR